MTNIIKKRWTKYIAKKSRIAIVFDFLFVLLLIAIIIPGTRQKLSSTIIKYTMFQPRETKEVVYLRESNWKLKGKNGSVIDFEKLEGKVLFINFWATWCPHCIAEMSSIQKLYNLYGNQIDFLLISNEEQNVIDGFMKKKGYKIPVYHNLSGEVPRELYSQSIPATYLISKNGRIVISKKGAADWSGQKVQHIVEQLLNE